MTSRTRSATVGTVVPRAEELYRQGLAENSSGRPLRGLRALTQAARLLSDPILIADQAAVRLAHRVTLARSTAESELNGLDRGLAVLDSVRDHVVATGDRETEVLLELHLGYMRARGGELHDGLAHLDAAVELLDHADPRSACNILLNRGMVRVFLGDLTRARPDYEHALAIAVEHELLIEHAKARHNLGELEGFAGNLARALRLMDEAAGLAAELSPAVAFVDRAKVLMEAGLHREADQTLLEAERLFRADRLWKDVGEVELARAQCALWSGEAAAARRLAGRARDRFRRRANHRWRREAELVLLQADLAGGRPGSRLAPPALRLASEFESEGLTSRGRTAKLLAAEAMLRAGDVHSAVLTAGQAGPVRPADALSARIQTRLVRAQLRMAGEDRSGARREIQTGFAELGRHQARFGSIDLQTAAAVHTGGDWPISTWPWRCPADRRPNCLVASSAAARCRAGSTP